MVNFIMVLIAMQHFAAQKCGRVEEQIELLKQKLHMIYLGEAFNGKTTKTARSHGKKFQINIKQETARILVTFLFLMSLATVKKSINLIASR